MCNTSQDNNVLQNFPRFWEEIHLKLARLIEQLLKSAATTPTTLGFIHNPGRKRENYNTKITFETKFLPFSAFILMYSRKSARLQYRFKMNGMNERNELKLKSSRRTIECNLEFNLKTRAIAL